MNRNGKTTTERGYGWEYQKARELLLRNKPVCHWCGINPATTADHEPPIELVGPHLNLVPACEKCNFGRGKRLRTGLPITDFERFIRNSSREW